MLTDLDLNTLHALHALLTEQHVTRAGRRVGLSQPAMSAALGRLRRYFDDELLVRTGNRYQRTPLAEELIDPLDQMMALIDETLTARRPFDPTSSQRELRIQLSDYSLFVLMAPLLHAAEAEAPGVRIRFTGMEQVTERNGPPADLTIAPWVPTSAGGATPLWRDEWLVAVSADHPGIGDELSADQLGELTYLRVRVPGIRNPAETHLRELGVELRVGTTVGSPISSLFLIQGTQWFTLAPRRLATRLAGAAGLRLLASPIPLPDLVEHLSWPRRTGDNGLCWLRELVLHVTAEI
jgi:DNA-binding transcriptional LysR family regulator